MICGRAIRPISICWNASDRAAPSFRGGGRRTTSRASLAARKLLHHPSKGLLRFEHASFQANDDPALELVIYAPV